MEISSPMILTVSNISLGNWGKSVSTWILSRLRSKLKKFQGNYDLRYAFILCIDMQTFVIPDENIKQNSELYFFRWDLFVFVESDLTSTTLVHLCNNDQPPRLDLQELFVQLEKLPTNFLVTPFKQCNDDQGPFQATLLTSSNYRPILELTLDLDPLITKQAIRNKFCIYRLKKKSTCLHSRHYSILE